MELTEQEKITMASYALDSVIDDLQVKLNKIKQLKSNCKNMEDLNKVKIFLDYSINDTKQNLDNVKLESNQKTI
ncbi:MAG: hypothetical protein PHN42_02370 [Bacilli bacterium]|nr:hypothetical protein [Bacilli bacterium]